MDLRDGAGLAECILTLGLSDGVLMVLGWGPQPPGQEVVTVVGDRRRSGSRDVCMPQSPGHAGGSSWASPSGAKERSLGSLSLSAYESLVTFYKCRGLGFPIAPLIHISGQGVSPEVQVLDQWPEQAEI